MCGCMCILDIVYGLGVFGSDMGGCCLYEEMDVLACSIGLGKESECRYDTLQRI